MARMSEHHQKLSDDGEGKCSVPMWRYPGVPAGFCDAPAFGEPEEPEYYWRDSTGRRRRSDMKYDGYVPGIACPVHGGPTKEEALDRSRIQSVA